MNHCDTAIVNVPLAKRGGGDLDAQIDRFKREQAAAARVEARAMAARRRAEKATAAALLAEHLPAIVTRHGAKFGAMAVRDTLTGWAKCEPAKLIAFVARLQAETVAAKEAQS